MKKRLEAELISIAHRILKLKSKSDLDQLYVESRKLYETLSVLKFVEDNSHAIQPKVSDADIEKMMVNSETSTDDEIIDVKNIEDQEAAIVLDNKSISEDEIMIVDSKPTADLSIEKENLDADADIDAPEVETVAVEAIETSVDAEATQPKISFEPDMDYSAEFIKKEINSNELISFEKKAEIIFEKPESPKPQQISFEDLLGQQGIEPQFEKKSDSNKPATLNEFLSKNATFGLNDRIGFVKNLFDGSEEDFNRVVSQTGTLDNAEEIKTFIDELVKPDYNNWENKEDYEARFMEIVLSRFA